MSEPHDTAARLAAALRRHAGLHGHVDGLRRLTGGATKTTWSFDLVAPEGRHALILQQAPALPALPASPDPVQSGPRRLATPRLAAADDARLMTVARAHGVPAPRVLAMLDVQDGLASGYITERVEGETLGRKLVNDPALAAARGAMAAQAGTILAAIHATPTQALPFLQRLSPAQELAVYGDLLERTGFRHAALAFALQWTRQHLPTGGRQTLVHSDFRTGNLIVGPEGIRCVLDWEIARIGDPMQDLGVLCMRTWRFGGTPEVGGFGARADLYAAYERASGMPVDAARVRFWEAFSNLKWAIGCVRRGLSVRADGSAASLELCAVGRRMEEPLWDFFQLIEG
ncbi:phosphotransferase family protein [Variovorax sp. H27-G14]|uniref:phosphotransferase family protein n=1 Tax=Variovorax sp. H27-G14 TaxID=3111914 RepID=UPI0038FD2888